MVDVGVDIGSLLMKKEEDVIATLKEKNINFRVAERDGNSYMLTQDWRPIRLNLIINGGLVIKITTG